MVVRSVDSGFSSLTLAMPLLQVSTAIPIKFEAEDITNGTHILAVLDVPVVYLSAADNSIGPRIRYNPPVSPPSEGVP